jgi:hypothetical protein
MELFIRIKNGQPFEHPILGDNFRQAFPNIDTNNLPPEFVKFTPSPPPNVGIYEVHEMPTYVLVNGVCTDTHNVRAMTAVEITARQDQVKNYWATEGYPSWVFNAEACLFEPPMPYPQDNKRYNWDEPTTSWVEVTYA